MSWPNGAPLFSQVHNPMPLAKILLIESERTTIPSQGSALLKKGFALMVENSPHKAIERARATAPDVVVLDAVSLRTSGVRLSRTLHSKLNGCPIVLITRAQLDSSAEAGASVVLVPPFTPRKLINAIRRLMPGDEDSCLQVGPIKLNLAQGKVSCGGREDHVTPKQARLLEVLMRHPGQLLTRKFLLKAVWETDYTGDTRTLDVHVSWLRQVVEADPEHPRYVKTIRGMGYRLDVPEVGRKT
ncbi:MAG: response regulator transcription factor [Anaerolineales bacterium]